MPDAVWPPSLTRAARVAEFRERTPELVIRTSMDVGPDKVRRRLAVNVREVDVALDLTGSQLATFDSFFVSTCQGGAIAFEWTHWRTGSTVRCRFLGPPEYRPRAPKNADSSEYWLVTFQIEVLPEAIASPVAPPVDTGLPPGFFDEENSFTDAGPSPRDAESAGAVFADVQQSNERGDAPGTTRGIGEEIKDQDMGSGIVIGVAGDDFQTSL